MSNFICFLMQRSFFGFNGSTFWSNFLSSHRLLEFLQGKICLINHPVVYYKSVYIIVWMNTSNVSKWENASSLLLILIISKFIVSIYCSSCSIWILMNFVNYSWVIWILKGNGGIVAPITNVDLLHLTCLLEMLLTLSILRWRKCYEHALLPFSSKHTFVMSKISLVPLIRESAHIPNVIKRTVR